MKKFFAIAISALASIALVFAILASSIFVNVFDVDVYEKEYKKFNTAEKIGISEDGLRNVTVVLVDYMSGERDDLVVNASIEGEDREVFNKKEKAHMVDVRNLCTTFNTAKDYAFIFSFSVFILLVFAMFLVSLKRKERTLKQNFTYSTLFCLQKATSTYKIASLIILGVGVCIGIWAAVDFRSFWRTFHELFFTNNLWGLSPEDDILMKMMMPRKFFSDIILRIALLFAGIFGATVVGSFVISKVLKKYSKI